MSLLLTMLSSHIHVIMRVVHFIVTSLTGAKYQQQK